MKLSIVIFCDESKLCIFEIKGRKLVWRRACTAYEKQNLIPTAKHDGGGVMVWEYMGSNGVRKHEFMQDFFFGVG